MASVHPRAYASAVAMLQTIVVKSCDHPDAMNPRTVSSDDELLRPSSSSAPSGHENSIIDFTLSQHGIEGVLFARYSIFAAD